MLQQDHCRGVNLPASINGEEIVPFRDIHNFSFSAKIEDGLGTEYTYTTLWVKNLLKIILSDCFRDIFNVLFSAKIQDGHQKLPN